jgi:hypothetical protein
LVEVLLVELLAVQWLGLLVDRARLFVSLSECL